MTDKELIKHLKKELATAERYAEDLHFKLSIYRTRGTLDSQDVPEDVEIYIKSTER